jgi:hypothetical protein
VGAVKKSGPLLKGGMFRKEEEIYDAEFRYLPMWSVRTTKEKRSLLARKEEARAYYVSAETGDLVSLEKGEIVFHRLLSGRSQKFRNLEEDKRFTFASKMPGEVDGLPKISISKEKACQTLELKIGVKSLSAELVLLPVWSLKVQHRTKRAKRSINMDAATGRLLVGNL